MKLGSVGVTSSRSSRNGFAEDLGWNACDVAAHTLDLVEIPLELFDLALSREEIAPAGAEPIVDTLDGRLQVSDCATEARDVIGSRAQPGQNRGGAARSFAELVDRAAQRTQRRAQLGDLGSHLVDVASGPADQLDVSMRFVGLREQIVEHALRVADRLGEGALIELRNLIAQIGARVAAANRVDLANQHFERYPLPTLDVRGELRGDNDDRVDIATLEGDPREREALGDAGDLDVVLDFDE